MTDTVKKERIRIFVDCHVFDGFSQGTTTYLKGLYGELTKDRSRDFFLAAKDTEKLKAIFGEADNIFYIRYKRHNKIYRLLIDIPKIIKKNRIHYAHFQYVTPPFRYCKYINTVHDILFMDHPEYFPLSYRIKNNILFGYSAKRAHLVLTVSEYSRQRIEHHFKLSNVIITPNAVDVSFFENYSKEEVRSAISEKFGLSKYWLYVSRWEPRKNHDLLLKVFSSGQYHDSCDLVFIGEKAITNKKYDKIYNALPLEIKEKVRSFTNIGFEDLKLLVRGASLSAYPSIAEGFGIPPLESAAAGIPTICSNSTAMAEFSFFRDTLFDPLSASQMDIAVRNALQGDNTPTIKEAVWEKYSWERSANILKEYLDKY